MKKPIAGLALDGGEVFQPPRLYLDMARDNRQGFERLNRLRQTITCALSEVMIDRARNLQFSR